MKWACRIDDRRCTGSCSVLAYEFMHIDMPAGCPGVLPLLATGIKRTWPDKIVFTYQGDGDSAAIGTAETIHACNRGGKYHHLFPSTMEFTG